MFTVHETLYTVQCTLDTGHCTLYCIVADIDIATKTRGQKQNSASLPSALGWIVISVQNIRHVSDQIIVYDQIFTNKSI